MSFRVDSSQLIANSFVVGGPGLGVLAENVPSAGGAGPALAYNDLSFPADNGKEVRVVVTRWPVSGVLFVYEDTSFTYDGDTDYAEYQLVVDGVNIGSPVRVDFIVGSTQITGTLASIEVTPFAATVNALTSISATTATMVTSPLQASVSTGNSISASTASIEVAAHQATVETETHVNAITASIEVTANQASVSLGSDILSSTAGIDITPYQASVDVGNSTNITATTAAVETSTYAATVYHSVSIDATQASIGVVGYQATVSQAGTISTVSMGYEIPENKLHFSFD